MRKMIYFDNSATTKVLPEAAAAALSVMTEDFGNPSSLHRLGLAAEAHLKQARKEAAAALSVHPDEIYFSSGGTESNNWALYGVARLMQKRGRHIISTAIEHPSVLNPLRRLAREGWEVDHLQPGADGRVRPEELAEKLRPDTVLLSVMQVNNESGAIQPLAELGALLRQRAPQAVFHVDGVQGFCKQRLDLKACGIDLYSASSHKIHGPKGCGLLYIRSGLVLPALLEGGGQERNYRSGTENSAGIAAFGVAIREAFRQLPASAEKVCAVRDTLLAELKARIPDMHVNSCLDERGLPYLLNLSFPGCKSETLLHYLEAEEIYVSAGSACSAKDRQASYVLAAQGLPEEYLHSALRFSFNRFNTPEEAKRAAERLAAAVEEIRLLEAGSKSNKKR